MELWTKLRLQQKTADKNKGTFTTAAITKRPDCQAVSILAAAIKNELLMDNKPTNQAAKSWIGFVNFSGFILL
ncbi:hypothetical protein ACX07_20440 [Vibrio parahaemolyticus]|nr:hypothetical protein ACX07_20440 [Vibrio parahaemolyticus]